MLLRSMLSIVLVGSTVPIGPINTTTRPLAGGDGLAPAVRVDPPLRRLTLVFSGDTLPHDPVIDSAQRWGNGTYDFRPMFARIAPIVSWADLAICHLETPVAPDGEALSPAPRYGVPKEIAAGIASAGYDRCSTASNHSLDRGDAGIDATVTALEDAGVSEAGMARTPDEVSPRVLDVHGVRVTHLSYTWGFNGFRLPADVWWRANLIDPVRVVADATAARAAGAEVVIVSLHWGNEGDWHVTGYQREIAARIMGSGTVDLIVGHHTHVIQPIERVAGRWVVFGMGNALSNMPTGALPMASSQDGELVTVVVREQPDGSFVVSQPVVYPTWVDRDAGHVIRPVLADLADPATPPGIRAQLAESLARTRSVVGDYFPPGA
jgi:poly-gamma-glutamate synthesis protein (capsule biosynthesis protein)